MSKPPVSSTTIPTPNFLVGQSVYSGYHSSQVCWPDFDEAEMDKALRAFGQRKRRSGALPPEE